MNAGDLVLLVLRACDQATAQAEANPALADAYGALKALLTRRAAAAAEALAALERGEGGPGRWVQTLAKALWESKADQDPELMAAAERLELLLTTDEEEAEDEEPARPAPRWEASPPEDHREQVAFYEAQAAAFQEEGDLSGEWSARQAQGQAYLHLEESQKALFCFREALDLARQAADREAEAATLGSLGDAYAAQGQVEQAVAQYEAQLALA
ncbi:MAG: tetratricopeptide repeat protein, partial [Chloroflexi bacterium]|nr:tetratricopeptide repeat protein [Chloroflexota bacterium]